MSPMCRFLLLTITALVAVSVTATDDSSPARLLVEKQVLNKYLVETRDILVNYNIFNIGGSAALNVKISDAAFALSHFDVISGLLKFTIPRIAPQSNVSHSVVVRPKDQIWGRFNFTAGEVSYQSEGSSDIQQGITSEPGEGFIVSLKEFDRRFSSHLSDWITFLVLALSTVLFPYILWNNSKTKYEALAQKKSK